jgi:tRNA(fMet)-specific endonuclease VapC
VILDSTFLVDMEREARNKKPGPAMDFLKSHPDEILCVTFTIAGEMAAGESLQDRRQSEENLSPFRFFGNRSEVFWNYGQIYRDLKARGLLIGSNDMWIGATGLVYGQLVVTRNRQEFSHI